MNDIRLLRTQKNRMLELIVSRDLDPAAFEWIDVESAAGVFSRLVYRPEPQFFFEVGLARTWQGHPFMVNRFSPGRHGRLDELRDSLETRESHVRSWLTFLRREISAPDLWAKVRELSPLTQLDDNQPLAAAQRDAFEQKLRAVEADIQRRLAETADASQAQVAAVAADVKYLVEASSRLGAKDLKNLVLAVLVTWLLGGIIPSNSAQVFWTALIDSIVETVPRALPPY